MSSIEAAQAAPLQGAVNADYDVNMAPRPPQAADQGEQTAHPAHLEQDSGRVADQMA